MLFIRKGVLNQSRMPSWKMDKRMNIYTYTPKNTFARKEYTISLQNQNTSKVTVNSPFLGQWTFNVELPLKELRMSLEAYCEGKETIQNIFPNLTPEVRDQFLTDPSFYENNTNY
jgi:hypothetical protein